MKKSDHPSIMYGIPFHPIPSIAEPRCPYPRMYPLITGCRQLSSPVCMEHPCPLLPLAHLSSAPRRHEGIAARRRRGPPWSTIGANMRPPATGCTSTRGSRWRRLCCTCGRSTPLLRGKSDDAFMTSTPARWLASHVRLLARSHCPPAPPAFHALSRLAVSRPRPRPPCRLSASLRAAPRRRRDTLQSFCDEEGGGVSRRRPALRCRCCC